MHFLAGERRHEGANDPHAGDGADAVAVVFVHGVEGAGLDLMHAPAIELLHRSLAFDAVARLQMVLLPQDHVEARLEQAVDQCHPHAVLRVQEALAPPFVAVRVALGADNILFRFDDHGLELLLPISLRDPGLAQALQVVVEGACVGVEVAVAHHGDGEVRPLLEALGKGLPGLVPLPQEAERRQQRGVAGPLEALLL